MADHLVDIEISRYGATPRFNCTASDTDDVETSPCRWYCIRPDCAEGCQCQPRFGADGELHIDYSTWTDHLDYCRYIEGWFDEDPFELMDGEPTLARSSPVVFRWNGDTYTWRYADAPALAEEETPTA